MSLRRRSETTRRQLLQEIAALRLIITSCAIAFVLDYAARGDELRAVVYGVLTVAMAWLTVRGWREARHA
jgi:hypothetical protein